MPHNPDQRPMSPEEVVAAVFGPPPREGQKNLEDFIKRELPKPERPRSFDVEVTVKDQEGKEVVFNLEMIRQQSIAFFYDLNLPKLAQSMESVDIHFSQEQILELQEKFNEGLNTLMFVPPVTLQQEFLSNIIEQTHTPMSGLQGNQQYSKEAYLTPTVKAHFPNNIEILNREKTQNKPYFILFKDDPEVDAQTLGKTPLESRELFKQKNLTGLTLPEYFISSRKITEDRLKDLKTKESPHPDTQKYTFLLDSVLPQDSKGSARVLGANWNLGDSQLKVNSDSPGHSNPDVGSRSSAIFEIL